MIYYDYCEDSITITSAECYQMMKDIDNACTEGEGTYGGVVNMECGFYGFNPLEAGDARSSSSRAQFDTKLNNRALDVSQPGSDNIVTTSLVTSEDPLAGLQCFDIGTRTSLLGEIDSCIKHWCEFDSVSSTPYPKIMLT